MKNKAFTLIELLAVIVILAIIALIATPIILGIIRNAKDQSATRSAELYVKAAELGVARKNLTGEEINITTCEVQSNGNLKCGNVDIEVDMDKTTATGGKITFNKGKIIKVENLHISDKYCNTDSNNKLVCTKEEGEAKQVGFTGTIYIDSEGEISKGDSIAKEAQVWCEVVPSYKEWCAVATDGSYNTCNEGGSYISQQACLNEISEAISAGNISEGQYTCEQGETVPAYNSCTDDNYHLETQQACLDAIAEWEIVPEGATCKQSTAFLPVIEYTTDIGEVNEDIYLKHEVENNIVKESYACIKYDGDQKEACLHGGDPSYYGNETTGNMKILKDLESEGFTCKFEDSKYCCEIGDWWNGKSACSSLDGQVETHRNCNGYDAVVYSNGTTVYNKTRNCL